MPQTRSVSIPLVLTMMTGIALVSESLLSARVAWKPFMPGRTTSISTRSGRSRLRQVDAVLGTAGGHDLVAVALQQAGEHAGVGR
jgi:hypothetical protein